MPSDKIMVFYCIVNSPNNKKPVWNYLPDGFNHFTESQLNGNEET